MAIKPILQGKTPTYERPNISEPRGVVHAPDRAMLVALGDQTSQFEPKVVGEIFIYHSTTPTVISDVGAAGRTLVTAGWELGDALNVGFDNDHLIIEYAGLYLVSAGGTIRHQGPSAVRKYHMHIAEDLDGEGFVPHPHWHVEQDADQGKDEAWSLTGVFDFPAGAKVGLFVQNDTSDDNVIMRHANITVWRIR